jgi:DNA invertase Pin-like site-specific DNA recombinase
LNASQVVRRRAGSNRTGRFESGAKADRVVLPEVLDYERPGDTLVVWRLARLGLSLVHLIETLTDLAS